MEFQRLTKANPKFATEFAAAVGPMFALSDNEKVLLAAIDRVNEPAPPRLAERFARLGVERPAAVWWFNPRAFDAALKHKAAAEGADAEFVRAFARHWQSIDAAAFHLQVGRDVELGRVLAVKVLLEKTVARKRPPA